MSSFLISFFQRALSLNHDLFANERLSTCIFTQKMLFTQITQIIQITQTTQTSISFSQKSTQNEDDDETKRRRNMNLQYDEKEINE